MINRRALLLDSGSAVYIAPIKLYRASGPAAALIEGAPGQPFSAGRRLDFCLEPTFILPVKHVENCSFKGADSESGQSAHGPTHAEKVTRPPSAQADIVAGTYARDVLHSDWGIVVHIWLGTCRGKRHRGRCSALAGPFFAAR